LVGDGGATTGGTGGTPSGGATGQTSGGATSGTTGGTSGGTSGDVVSACTSFCTQLTDCWGQSSSQCGAGCQADPTGAFNSSGITCPNYAVVYNCLAGLPCADLNGDGGLSGALAETACFNDNGCH
jgi:hypothetical protein